MRGARCVNAILTCIRIGVVLVVSWVSIYDHLFHRSFYGFDVVFVYVTGERFDICGYTYKSPPVSPG
jgi:hypothetical protein